ncbi:MAG: hypothetical protein WEB67_06035 [Acidimicrobiia bacterium]
MGLSETISAFLGGDADDRCDLDASGSNHAWGLGPDVPQAVVIVAAATDALKTTRSGFVTGSLDRSRVWEIAGVSLRRDIVSNFAGVDSVAELVEQLRASGVDLVAIERSDAL